MRFLKIIKKKFFRYLVIERKHKYFVTLIYDECNTNRSVTLNICVECLLRDKFNYFYLRKFIFLYDGVILFHDYHRTFFTGKQ